MISDMRQITREFRSGTALSITFLFLIRDRDRYSEIHKLIVGARRQSVSDQRSAEQQRSAAQAQRGAARRGAAQRGAAQRRAAHDLGSQITNPITDMIRSWDRAPARK